MVKLIIRLMILLFCVPLNAQPTAEQISSSFNQNLSEDKVNPEVVNVSNSNASVIGNDCIEIKGRLADLDGNLLQLEDVRILVTNLSMQESVEKEYEIYTNEEGVFQTCLVCEKDFSLSAYPEDYYFDNIIVTTRNMECSVDQPLEVMIKLGKIDQKENPVSGKNMNSLTPDNKETDETIKERNERNKSMLESISVAEEMEEEAILEEEEIEIPVMEKEVSPVEETSVTKTETSTEPGEAVFSEIPNIYYDFNSYKIAEKDKNYLSDLATYLKINPGLKLSIKAYTDKKGKKAYNKWLSKRRAEEVMTYLMESGLEKNRIEALGKGEEEMLKEDSESRRVEFELVDTKTIAENSVISESTIEENFVYTSKIYYDFDQHLLNDISKEEVTELINQLRNNPEIKVEVRSHTDARGSEQYNQWLSQKRANEVVRFIVKQGIDRNRLKAKGFGESNLINECSDGVTCSKADHLVNRRTEFIFNR